jgi:hypothetical protein
MLKKEKSMLVKIEDNLEANMIESWHRESAVENESILGT